MDKIFQHIKQEHSKHPNFAITLKVLECLDYIEKNIDTIAQSAGKASLLRHPENHLAFHLAGFNTPEIAKDQLLKLINETKGCFNGILAITDPLVQQSILIGFLNNINDSEAGCMEARLRPALMYYGLYQSNGCQDITTLLHELGSQFTDLTVRDVLDFFADKVEHQVMVIDHDQIKPLNWRMIKDCMLNIFGWETIEDDWLSYGKTLTLPEVVQTPLWFFYNFKESRLANHSLAYVKSILPEHQKELAKANVNYDEQRKTYFFRLTGTQYLAFQHLMESAQLHINKQKQEIDTQSTRTSKNEFELQSINSLNEPVLSRLSHLDMTQLELLRNRIREQAKSLRPNGDFVIKSLRVDEFHYFRNFIEMIFPPFKRYALRVPKRYFTVTGSGIFQRPSYQGHSNYPLKRPQYTSEEKTGYSLPQPASFGFESLHPNVFGFDKRAQKLVGVLLEYKDILLSDRLFIYDGGTVGRPYDSSTPAKALEYFNNKTAKNNKVLFSSSQLADFKNAVTLPENKSKYNEVLARMRWNTDSTSKIFVASDTLEARLWAQEYVRIIKAYLSSLNIDSDNVKICYYFPDQPKLHFKEYTIEEQELDQVQARLIYANQEQRRVKYSLMDYEILMALPASEISSIFTEVYQGQNLILTLLSEGYIHIFQSLIQKVSSKEKEYLYQVLDSELKRFSNRVLIANILYFCLQRKEEELATFIFNANGFPGLAVHNLLDAKKNPMLMAAEKGLTHWVKLLLSSNHKLSVNSQDSNQNTLLHIAAAFGHTDLFIQLLKDKTVDVDIKNKSGQTALFIASANGHNSMVAKLLKVKHIVIDKRDDHINSAFNIAIENGHSGVVAEFVKSERINLNVRDDNYSSPLHIASANGHSGVVAELLKHPKIDVNAIVTDQTPLSIASENNNCHIVKELLKHPAIDPNVKIDIFETTALHTASRKGHGNVVDELLKHPATDVNQTYFHDTPLSLASKHGHFKIVAKLLKHSKIDVNKLCRNEETALYSASRLGHGNVVTELLKHPKIDVNKRARNISFPVFSKFSPLEIVRENNHLDVFISLLTHKNICIDMMNDTIYDTLSDLAMDKKYSSPISDFIENYLQQQLLKYKSKSIFTNIYGLFTTDNRENNLQAITALLENDEQKIKEQQAILAKGELGRIHSLMQILANHVATSKNDGPLRMQARN